MADDSSARTSVAMAAVAAVVGPPLIAVLFLILFDWAHEVFPRSGYAEATRNDRLVLGFVVSLIVFVVATAWVARRRARIAFLAIAIPIAALSYLAAFYSLMAP